MLNDRFGPLDSISANLSGACTQSAQAKLQLSAQPKTHSFCIAMIWLRPEVIKHADPQSLCRLSCTSKTLQIDLQGIKAWARLAEAQYPPPTPRDDNEARSHVKRRELAKAFDIGLERRVLEGVTLQQALSRQAPAPVAFPLDEFSDFTYFLRITDGERLIWEGDLRGESYGHVLHFPMSHVKLDWTGPSEGVEMTLVAVRDHDQAMVPLGFFYIDDDGVEHDYSDIQDGDELDFMAWELFTSPGRSDLSLLASLVLTQDADVHTLELKLRHTIPVPRLGEYYGDGYLFDESRFRHVLSYLAGIHPAARASAFATIESWIADGERNALSDLVQE